MMSANAVRMPISSPKTYSQRQSAGETRLTDLRPYENQNTSKPQYDTTDAQEMLERDNLKKLQGDNFTKQYHSDQEDVHEDAVDLLKTRVRMRN